MGGRGGSKTQLYLHSFVCDRFPYIKFEFLILYDLSCGQVDVSVQKVFGGHFPKLGSIYRWRYNAGFYSKFMQILTDYPEKLKWQKFPGCLFLHLQSRVPECWILRCCRAISSLAICIDVEGLVKWPVSLCWKRTAVFCKGAVCWTFERLWPPTSQTQQIHARTDRFCKVIPESGHNFQRVQLFLFKIKRNNMLVLW